MSTLWDVFNFSGEESSPSRQMPTPEEAYARGYAAGHREGSFYGSGFDPGRYGPGNQPPPPLHNPYSTDPLQSQGATMSWQPPPVSRSTDPLQSQGAAMSWQPPAASARAPPAQQRRLSPPSQQSRPSRPTNQKRQSNKRSQADESASIFEDPLGWLFGNEAAQAQPATASRSLKSRGVTSGRPGGSVSVPLAGSGNAAPPAYSRGRGSKESTLESDKDTTIGRGFAAHLKRGVKEAEKQAEDRSKHTEMVPQKDGGFIATIQKGFEGLFGHLASSKEEVLKKRGPMPALEYEAVPGDDIDQKVQYLARWLPPKLGHDLMIYRVSRGQYQIGDEDVELKWHSWMRPDGVPCKEVFVFMPKDGGKTPFEPLPLYLQHSASVANNLKNGHAVTQVPHELRVSFPEARGTNLVEADSDQRFNAMALAAEQAKLREKAAVEWRSRTRDGRDIDDATTETPGESRSVPSASEANSHNSMNASQPRAGERSLAPLAEEGDFSKQEQKPSEPSVRQVPSIQRSAIPPSVQHASGLLPPPPMGVLSAPIGPGVQSFPTQGVVPVGLPQQAYPGIQQQMALQQQMRPQTLVSGVAPGSGTFYGSQTSPQGGTFYGSQGTFYGASQPMMPIAFVR